MFTGSVVVTVDVYRECGRTVDVYRECSNCWCLQGVWWPLLMFTGSVAGLLMFTGSVVTVDVYRECGGHCWCLQGLWQDCWCLQYVMVLFTVCGGDYVDVYSVWWWLCWCLQGLWQDLMLTVVCDGDYVDVYKDCGRTVEYLQCSGDYVDVACNDTCNAHKECDGCLWYEERHC